MPPYKRTKDTDDDKHSRMELLFVLLFRYLRQLRSESLQKAAGIAAEIAAEKAKHVLPIVTK
jgi:hypothetical protein